MTLRALDASFLAPAVLAAPMWCCLARELGSECRNEKQEVEAVESNVSRRGETSTETDRTGRTHDRIVASCRLP